MKTLFRDDNLRIKEIINVLILLLIFGAVFGFIWETIFYRIDLGYFVKRGSSFGPIVPIYGYGAVLIVLFTYHFKDKPLLVFFINSLLLGTLEYVTGWALYEFSNKRLWDYNTEMLNFGNINGFICARSVISFGFTGLFLIYFVLPKTIKLVKKVNPKFLSILCYLLLILFFIDEFAYMIIKG